MLAHSIIITHLFPTVSIYQIFTETYAVLCYEVCKYARLFERDYIYFKCKGSNF